MKAKSGAGICLVILLFAFRSKAQVQNLSHLEITTSKTTLIVSHFRIRSVDRGSRDILVQKVKGIDTVLELKAARPNFPETNLTLVTGDGKVHMFLVTFNPQPPVLWYPLFSRSSPDQSREGQEDTGELTEADFATLSDSILKQKSHFQHVSDRSFGVGMSLTGIFIHEEVLFFRLQLTNRSQIPYDISQFSFYIRDDEQSKRTASQDLGLTPIFFQGSRSRLEGRSKRAMVVALPKFTIPNHKALYIVLKEKNGGRLLRIRIKNKLLIRAREI